MRKIFIAIPTWQRFQQTIDSFKQVMDDERVSRIYITDDASEDDSYEKLKWHFKDNDKAVLTRNETNQDCYRNKHTSMQNAKGEFGILLDSDNTITTEYIDALYAIPEWSRHIIYQPSFAAPHFDFRKWEGLMITRENVAQYIDTHLMTALNAANHFIHRDEYLKIWDGNTEPVTSDSIYVCLCWLRAGNTILITPNLQYDHYISPNGKGHYQENYKRTGNFHQIVMDELKQLK